MRVAAIDLGTNSFLCTIAERETNGYRILSDQVEMVRLGQGLAKSTKKILHPEALERASQALEKFADKISLLNVEKVLAVATSAARDAENKQDLLAIAEKFKIPLQIISGQEEARLTFQGAMMDHDPDTSMVIDIGGGSTEFLYLEELNIVGKSLDVGGVRLTETFFTTDIPSAKEIEALQQHIEVQLKSLKLPKDPKKWVAVAGTPTTLACMYLGLKDFDESKIQKLRLKLDDIKGLLKKMMVPIEVRQNMAGLHPKRADIIVAATYILIGAMEFFNIPEIVVSTKGIRYGIIKELL